MDCGDEIRILQDSFRGNPGILEKLNLAKSYRPQLLFCLGLCWHETKDPEIKRVIKIVLEGLEFGRGRKIEENDLGSFMNMACRQPKEALLGLLDLLQNEVVNVEFDTQQALRQALEEIED